VTNIDPPLGACPAWCEKPAHHSWEDEWLNGPVRVHIWARTVTHPDRHPADQIRIEGAEQHTEDGVVRRRTIVVDVEAPTETDLDLDTAARACDFLGDAITLADAGGGDLP
jgi:hypothetical protein